MKGFVLGLALKQRRNATQKLPIKSSGYHKLRLRFSRKRLIILSDIAVFSLPFPAAEIVNAIKASKDVQGLCLGGNTVGVDAARAIAEALGTRPEFEVCTMQC